MGMSNLSREIKSSGANQNREIFIFPVQLTTSRIGNLTYPVDFTLATSIHIGSRNELQTDDGVHSRESIRSDQQH